MTVEVLHIKVSIGLCTYVMVDKHFKIIGTCSVDVQERSCECLVIYNQFQLNPVLKAWYSCQSMCSPSLSGRSQSE